MALKEELSKTNEGIRAQIPTDVLAIMDRATADLKAQDLAMNAAKVGDAFPSAALFNAQGKQVALEEILQEGSLVATFYRGGWCPYCNIELRAYEAILSEVKANGGQLVAITPETAENSRATIEENGLSFDVLTDQDNALAKQLGLLIALPEAVQVVYKSLNIDLQKYNGNDKAELPIPATFVVGQDGRIIYRFIDEDYTKRAEPSEILESLIRG